MSTERRLLIVNADDFGQSIGVNRGIVAAHHNGIVTSTSVMTRWPALADAVACSRECPRLGLGLHLDFGEWTFRDGEWRRLYQVVDVGDRVRIAQEARRQLDDFRGAFGCSPTHIDSHQHTHLEEPLRAVALELAAALGVPLRHLTPGVQYLGGFYGQTDHGGPNHEAISVEALIATLAAIPPGTTELACHPSIAEDLDTMYRHERLMELRTLCDPRVRSTLAALNIDLISFKDLSGSEVG